MNQLTDATIEHPQFRAPEQPWHAATIEATFARLGTSGQGLAAADAAARLATYGPTPCPSRRAGIPSCASWRSSTTP